MPFKTDGLPYAVPNLLPLLAADDALSPSQTGSMTTSPSEHLARMMTGYWMSQAIYVAAKLELADQLTGGAKSVNELATATKTHADSLYRLLRALASVGVFKEVDGRRFELTPAAEMLRKDVLGSQWAWAVMMGEEHFTAWGDLIYSIRTGEGAFRKHYGQPVFEYLSHHPESARVFDAAMTSIHGRETAPMLEAYDFGQFAKIIDVGGGNGSLLSQLLERYPTVQGTIFDLPHVVERAEARLANSPVRSRLSFASGNFFQSITPSGANAILMRHIIHDWNDEQCTTILRNCAAALAPGGKVIVIESVIPPGNEWNFGKWLDLTMLVIPEGRERTADEYDRLFGGAGLRLTQIVATAGDVSLIIGEK
jgi:ubiquinone/menaquinone biosynthesis C-methylase UbiE